MGAQFSLHRSRNFVHRVQAWADGGEAAALRVVMAILKFALQPRHVCKRVPLCVGDRPMAASGLDASSGCTFARRMKIHCLVCASAFAQRIYILCSFLAFDAWAVLCKQCGVRASRLFQPETPAHALKGCRQCLGPRQQLRSHLSWPGGLSSRNQPSSSRLSQASSRCYSIHGIEKSETCCLAPPRATAADRTADRISIRFPAGQQRRPNSVGFHRPGAGVHALWLPQKSQNHSTA